MKGAIGGPGSKGSEPFLILAGRGGVVKSDSRYITQKNEAYGVRRFIPISSRTKELGSVSMGGVPLRPQPPDGDEEAVIKYRLSP